MNDCQRIRELLEDHAAGAEGAEGAEGREGTADLTGRARLERHLAACADCRRELAQLEALLAAARALPRTAEPRRDLWPGIAARLDAAPEGAGGRRLRFPRAAVPRHWLAAAAALALVVAGAGVAGWWSGRVPDSPPAGVETTAVSPPAASSTTDLPARLSPDLRAAMTRQRRLVGPAEAAALEADLLLLAQAQRELRAAAEDHPGNPELYLQLAARQRQQAALVQRLMRI